MYILAVNSGSSSLKIRLYEVTKIQNEIQEKMLQERMLINLNSPDSWEVKINQVNQINQGSEFSSILSQQQWQERGWFILELIEKYLGLNSINKIQSVVHRIVFGYDYTKPEKITATVWQKLLEIQDLAPLHNPPAMLIIKQLQDKLQAEHFAVFDTAFHSCLPDIAREYAIDKKLIEQYKLFRYGYHGISYEYILNLLISQNPTYSKKKIIICHLGSGSSVCAIKAGQSVDTSMGFGPNEGLIMATRSGDIGSDALIHLLNSGLNTSQLQHILYKQSGLLAVSGYCQDMKRLIADSQNGKEQAQYAVESYVYRLCKYIGAYAAALNGVDCLVFTGAIGYKSDIIRQMVCQNLEFLDCHLDLNLNSQLPLKTNKTNNLPQDYSQLNTSSSRVDIWAVKTNEELQMVRSCLFPVISSGISHTE
jgi:acetate kinase